MITHLLQLVPSPPGFGRLLHVSWVVLWVVTALQASVTFARAAGRLSSRHLWFAGRPRLC